MVTLLFHLNSFLGGGIEKVLLELLWGLDPGRYRVKLSIAHNLGELEIWRDKIPPYVEVSYILGPGILTETKKKKILKTATLAEKLFEDIVLPPFKKRVHAKKLKELIADADVIIDFDMTLAGYTHVLRDKKKAAYCHFSFSHYWDGNRKKLNKLARRLSKYDKVVMLCDEMKEDAEAHYPFLRGHIERIYNALDIAKVKERAREPLDSAYSGLDQGFFLSAGRLEESQKDFTMLIKGYAAAVKEYDIDEQLVIIGAGPSRAELELLAQSEEVADKVTFAGYQENPYKWMANCRLFLFCSRFEGLPTVLLEALALDCPIIATATPTGVQEILMYGKAGILVKPGAVDELAMAIRALYNDTAAHEYFRQNAKAILGQFQIQYMVGRFEELIVNPLLS